MKAQEFFKNGGTGIITVLGGTKYSLDSMAQLRSIDTNILIEAKFKVGPVAFDWLYDEELFDDNQREFMVKPKQLIQVDEFFMCGGVVEVYKHRGDTGVSVCRLGDFLCTICNSHDLFDYESQQLCYLDRIDYVGVLHGVEWCVAFVTGGKELYLMSKDEY